MSKTIFVIDDDLTNVKVLQARLVKEGFGVEAAINGEGALKRLEGMVPDLIILDIQMPQMDGYTFLLELRKLKKFNHIPIIVLTSRTEMEPIFKLNGVKDYIVKPFTFDVLLPKIRALLP